MFSSFGSSCCAGQRFIRPGKQQQQQQKIYRCFLPGQTGTNHARHRITKNDDVSFKAKANNHPTSVRKQEEKLVSVISLLRAIRQQAQKHLVSKWVNVCSVSFLLAVLTTRAPLVEETNNNSRCVRVTELRPRWQSASFLIQRKTSLLLL